MHMVDGEHGHSHGHCNCGDHTHEHTHTHSHPHTHDGDHAHEHTHEHAHNHGEQGCSSCGCVGECSKPANEQEAILAYMLDHNRHHAEELHDLAHSFDEVTADLIHDAVDKLGESNDLIEQALSLIANQSE